MSTVPLADPRRDAFFQSEKNLDSSKSTFKDVTKDLNGLILYFSDSGLKEAVLSFFFAYISLNAYLMTDPTASTPTPLFGLTTIAAICALMFYVISFAAGDNLNITPTTAAMGWLATWLKMRDSMSFNNILGSLGGTCVRIFCMLSGSAAAIGWLDHQYGRDALLRIAKVYLWTDQAATGGSTWNNASFFLYVMFYNLPYVGLVLIARHKVNNSDFMLMLPNNKAFPAYSALSVLLTRVTSPMAIAAYYWIALLTASPNIGEPIMLQVYVMLEWYLSMSHGLWLFFVATFTAVGIAVAIFSVIYFVVKNGNKAGYMPLKTVETNN